MRSDQPTSTTGASSAPSSDPVDPLQPANSDERPSQDSQSDAELYDPSAPSHGTPIWPRRSRGTYVPGPPYQSSVTRGNGATAHSDIPSILHPKFSDSPLNFRTLPQQIQRGNASQHSGTLEYPYVGQHQIIYPSQITKTFFHGRRQSASLPQDSLGPHPQSQARVKSKPLGYVFRKNISFRRPPKAVTMRPRRGVVHKSWSRVTSLPLSIVRGIRLERPRPENGESTVLAWGDTCITLSFDMKSFSRGSANYDGLKIPSTPSVRQRGIEEGKKLLNLQIRVLGAATKTPYGALCHECKDRNGDRDAFPDFHAKSDILVPQGNGKVIVAFTLACYSKHREPHDSNYCLEVVLNGGALPIEYELPYSFIIGPKLPSRTRYLATDVDDVDEMVPPPHKLPRTSSGHIGSPVSQGVCPPRPDNISTGGSTGLTPSVISDAHVAPVNDHHLASPAGAPMPSRRWRQVSNAVRDEPAEGRDIVVINANPHRGPMTGGTEIWIWISGWDFPTNPFPLYARFGDNFASVFIKTPDLLSCFLPPANVPGRVSVALSRSLIPSAPVLGTSLCHFEYVTDLNEISPVIHRIQGDCTPEVAAALDIIHKEMKKHTSERIRKDLLSHAL